MLKRFIYPSGPGSGAEGTGPVATGQTIYFSDTFETADTDLVPPWAYRTGVNVTLNTNPSFSHGGSNSGRFYYAIAAGAPAALDSSQWISTIITPALNHWFMRGYFYLATPTIGLDTFAVQRKILWWSDSTNAAISQVNYSNFLVLWTATGGVPSPTTHYLAFGGNAVGGCAGTMPSLWDITTFSWDTWYGLEVEIQLNTLGNSDGILRVWKNGTQVYSNTALNLRGTCGDVSFFSVGFQTSRSNSEQIDEYRYWDDVVIASSYIGP